MKLTDLVGTSGTEIIITNPDDAKITITGDCTTGGSFAGTGLYLDTVEYIKIQGNNYSSEEYGIENPTGEARVSGSNKAAAHSVRCIQN